jgi:hypothetical protein
VSLPLLKILSPLKAKENTQKVSTKATPQLLIPTTPLMLHLVPLPPNLMAVGIQIGVTLKYLTDPTCFQAGL